MRAVERLLFYSIVETIFRASGAGTVFALSPRDLLPLNQLVDGLSLQGLSVFRLPPLIADGSPWWRKQLLA